MKHILIFLLLSCYAPLWSQITTDSVAGTWVNTNTSGKEQKLVITTDSVTVVQPYKTAPGSNEWKTVTYSGSYTIEKGNTIHVIFNEDPREEAFYKIVRAQDGSLQIVVETFEKRKKTGVIYKRQ
jgi:hypothetical protein